MAKDIRVIEDRKSYTVEEAARIWGWPRTCLYEEIRKGRLHAALRVGTKNGMRVTGREMERWIAEELVSAR